MAEARTPTRPTTTRPCSREPLAQRIPNSFGGDRKNVQHTHTHAQTLTQTQINESVYSLRLKGPKRYAFLIVWKMRYDSTASERVRFGIAEKQIPVTQCVTIYSESAAGRSFLV